MLQALCRRMLRRSLWVYHANSGGCNGCDIEVLNVLTRARAVKKSAFATPADRPRAVTHFESLAVQRSLVRPTRLLLIDDFITRGATLLGAASRLQLAYPQSEIRGFALVRSMTDGDIAAIGAPCEGTVILNEAGESTRRP